MTTGPVDFVSADLAPLTPDAVEVGGWDLLVAYTDEWLRQRGYTANTREAYRRDVLNWLSWCSVAGVNPLRARFTHVNTWRQAVQAGGTVNTSVARMMSAVSSWYAFLVRLRAVPANPAAEADRPRIDHDATSTVPLSKLEAQAVMAAAQADGPRTAALFGLLVHLGIRVSEACHATIADLGWRDNHRTLLVHGKGGKTIRRALPPATGRAVDAYLAQRAAAAGVAPEDLSGLLLVTATGRAIDRAFVFRKLRALAARAGVRDPRAISPHSLRHTWNETARRAGAPLETRRVAMGHADSRTTCRYDQAGQRIDEDPAYLVAVAIGDGTG